MKPLGLPLKLNFLCSWYVEQEKKILKTLEDAARKDFEEREKIWVLSVKKKAISNYNNEVERMRIAWVNKFKIPKYRHHDEYTLEEMLLESWEQFYFENPNHLENQRDLQKEGLKKLGTLITKRAMFIDALEKELYRSNPRP